MIALLAGLLLAQAAAPPPPAAAEPPITVTGQGGCGPAYATLYISPVGEPSRTDGRSDPMVQWFAEADSDHDGRLTLAELTASADRFFASLDRDHSGEIDPQEMQAYEYDVAPEIKLFQQGQDRRPRNGEARREAKREARARADYHAPIGAGEYASLNIPEPVASADYDLNRGVSRAELERAAAERFAALDAGHRGYLTLDALPRSPDQQRIDACHAKDDKKRR